MGMMNTNIYIFVFMMPINILYFSGDLLCQLYFIGLCNDSFLQDKTFGYCLSFNLLFYYCYYHGCVPSDLPFLGSFLKKCSQFVVLAAASKCSFNYLAMQVDWKHILLGFLSMDELHAFGVAPLWDNFWLTALFQCLSNLYVIM